MVEDLTSFATERLPAAPESPNNRLHAIVIGSDDLGFLTYLEGVVGAEF